jgi:hypothetical protein
MAKKTSLNVRSEAAYFTMLGISCHLRDYRLSFLFNHNLGFAFVKRDDLQTGITNNSEEMAFSFYSWKNEDRQNSFYLIANRNQEAVLIPEMKQFDFLLIVEGKFGKTEKNSLIRSLCSLPGILTVFDSEITKIKNHERLLTDVEMHVTNLQRVFKLKYQPK